MVLVQRVAVASVRAISRSIVAEDEVRRGCGRSGCGRRRRARRGEPARADAHQRRHAAADADDQQPSRAAAPAARTSPPRRRGTRASPARPAATKYGDMRPPSTCLTVMLSSPCGCVGVRGDRVGAPVAHAVDLRADAQVLAGAMAGPLEARPDHDGGGVAGLGPDLPDRAGQLARRPARVQQRRCSRRGAAASSPRARASAAAAVPWRPAAAPPVRPHRLPSPVR